MQRATEENPQPGPGAPEKANRQWRSALGQRWLTALVAIPIVLIFVWFGGWWAFAGTLLVVVLCTNELYQMMLNSGYRPLIVVSLGLSVLFLVASMLPQQRLLLLETGLGAAVLVSLPWLFFRKKLDGALVDWALTLAFSIYLGWPMSFFLLLRGYDLATIPGPGGAWLYLPRGTWWVLAVLLGVWGFDGAAFFVGHYFGKHRLAPRISPAKTWEGVAGGLVLSITAALLITVVPLGVPWYLAIVLGILIGVAAVLGDLAESLIKRQTQVKDSGQFMPGHGGMLDRMDSVLFVVIVVYVFSQFVGQ
ncbi:MAG: phosphatidate cytidylyltransferase [Ktedonobacteraceae bacterium]